jgi:hypothetical protein
MKHVKLFENFKSGSSTANLNVGDVVFIRPTEAEFTVVAVDSMEAKEIESLIMDFETDYYDALANPIKLEITDSNKNYVVWDVVKGEARLVSENEAHQLNQTGDYIGAFLKGGELEWEEPIETNPIDWKPGETQRRMDPVDWERQKERDMNPKYIVPAVKDRIIFIDGHGSLMFIDEPVRQFYEDLNS